MKKLFLSAISFVAIGAPSALSADLPSIKSAPVAAAVPMWTGFYAGLNAGYNFGTNGNFNSQNYGAPAAGGRVSTSPLAFSGIASNNQYGFIGGAQVGYNYQWASNFIVGLEADIAGTNTRGTSRIAGSVSELYTTNITIDAAGSTTVNGGIDYLGTVRGRLGYLWNPTLLLFGTGGFAYGGAWANVSQIALSEVTATTPGGVINLGSSLRIGAGQQNQLLTGWTAGGGVEWMFMPNWSLKAEALYWDLGRMNIGTYAYATGSVNSWGRSNLSYSGVTARAGVNYHFNWASAPVVAKY